MSIFTKFKKIISGMIGGAMVFSMLSYFPVIADDSEKYPYVMFAASDAEGAIAVKAANICVNGNLATNGTIALS